MECGNCKKGLEGSKLFCDHCGTVVSNYDIPSLPVDIDSIVNNINSNIENIMNTVPTTHLDDENKSSEMDSYELVEMRDVSIRTQISSAINISSIAAGASVIDWIEIENETREDIVNVMLSVWLSPDYGEPWVKTIPEVGAFDSVRVEGINLPLNTSKMSEVKEAETAYLRIEIKTDERVLFSESREITVHAANEWRIGNNEYPEGAYTLSLFVTPNSPSVDNILSSASDILERLGYKVSFEGYQSHSKERIYEIAGAIYLALKDELKIKYIVPPASFEKTGQKIRSASQILMHERGTCLDLAVLLASCLEAAGLNPVLFLIPGHAFSGLWTTDRSTKEKMSTSTVMINELVDTEAILPIEATAFTSNHSFEDSVSIASAKIKKNDELAMIDVVSCRLHGIKPMNLGGVR